MMGEKTKSNGGIYMINMIPRPATALVCFARLSANAKAADELGTVVSNGQFNVILPAASLSNRFSSSYMVMKNCLFVHRFQKSL